MANELTRRKFLKAGALFLPAMGLLRPTLASARWWAMQGKASSATSSFWNETDESAVASANIYACLMDNALAGGNDTGQGAGLAGADLVLTQSGNVAGSELSGGFYRRAIDDSDDYFNPTVPWTQAFLESATWIIIAKGLLSGIADGDGFMGFRSEGGLNGIYCLASTGKMVTTWADDPWTATQTPTTALPTGSVFYMFWGFDGTSVCSGWHTSFPISWGAIPDGQKASDAQALSWSALGWDFQTRKLFSRPDSANAMNGYAYFVLASKSWSAVMGA